jgi:hypothetical protein
MTLDELQTKLRTLTVGIEHPRVGSALALAEECGEVMRCVLDKEYYGISLAKSAERAVAKIAKKAPQWRAELGDRLIRLRERMDG